MFSLMGIFLLISPVHWGPCDRSFTASSDEKENILGPRNKEKIVNKLHHLSNSSHYFDNGTCISGIFLGLWDAGLTP